MTFNHKNSISYHFYCLNEQAKSHCSNNENDNTMQRRPFYWLNERVRILRGAIQPIGSALFALYRYHSPYCCIGTGPLSVGTLEQECCTHTVINSHIEQANT